MKKIIEKLDVGELLSPEGIKKIQETIVLMQNSKEVFSYWNPLDNSKREAAKKRNRKIKKERKVACYSIYLFVEIHNICYISNLWPIIGRCHGND